MLGQVSRFRSFALLAFISFTVLTGAGGGVSVAAAAHGKPVKNAEGIDVSHWQGAIDWSKVASAGKSFAFIKATQGTTFLDSRYAFNHAGARAAGLTPGAYHYADPATTPGDAVAQADWFVANAAVASNDLRPALDLEITNGLSASALTQWALDWLNEVYRLTGRKAFVFTFNSFWVNSMGNTQAIAQAGYGLWISAGSTVSSRPSRPTTGPAWAGRSGSTTAVAASAASVAASTSTGQMAPA